jgi:hypothetical protein
VPDHPGKINPSGGLAAAPGLGYSLSPMLDATVTLITTTP